MIEITIETVCDFCHVKKTSIGFDRKSFGISEFFRGHDWFREIYWSVPTGWQWRGGYGCYEALVCLECLTKENKTKARA